MYLAPNRTSSRQAGGVASVVVLHVAVVYALLHGLGHQVVEVLRQPLQTRILADAAKPRDEAKPPPPRFAPPPPPYIPPPEVRIQQPAPQTNAIAAITTVKPADPPPPAPAPVAAPVRVPPVVDAAHSCHQPDYPATSRRLEEEGAVVLQFLINTDGSVADSRVETSSGHPRLDEAAQTALSRCTFKPGTVDGKPERSWARLRYVWKLE